MKIRTRHILSILSLSLFVLFSIGFIYTRRNLLFESTLLDREVILGLLGLSFVSFIFCFLLIRKIKPGWIKRSLYIYLAVFLIATAVNEIIIYKTNRPEILLEASRSGFMNGMKLYLRDDDTYKAERYSLLNSEFSYGTFKKVEDTIYLNAKNRRRSLLHGQCVYKKDPQPGTLFNNTPGYLYRTGDDDKPFSILHDKIFNK